MNNENCDDEVLHPLERTASTGRSDSREFTRLLVICHEPRLVVADSESIMWATYRETGLAGMVHLDIRFIVMCSLAVTRQRLLNRGSR